MTLRVMQQEYVHLRFYGVHPLIHIPKLSFPQKMCMLCFVVINNILFNLLSVRILFKNSSIILVSDFLFYVFILLVPCALKY